MWLNKESTGLGLSSNQVAVTLTIALQLMSVAMAVTQPKLRMSPIRSANNDNSNENQKQNSPTRSKTPPNRIIMKILSLSKRDTIDQTETYPTAASTINNDNQSNSALSIPMAIVDQQVNAGGGGTDFQLTSVNGSEAEEAPGDDTKVLDVNLIQAVEYGLFRHSLSVSVILTVAYTMVFVIGIVGNSFVVAIVCKSPRMRTVTNYFIANLALADILVLLLCLPATLASNLFIPYVLGLFVCKTVSYLQGVAVSASINTMVAVTMDRFLAICFPMDWHMSRRMARWTIACIWLFSLAISLPWAIYFTIQPSNYSPTYTFNYCTEAWPNDRIGIIYFVCANLILLYLFPATVILLCYLGIWYKIERRNIPGDRPKGLRIELIMQKSKLKVVKMMMVVVVIFLLSWLPLYLISARVKLAQDQNSIEDWILNLMPLAQWLGSSNSCINPILYTFFNSKYKREFIDMLRAGFCCKPIGNSDTKQRMAANGLMTVTTGNGATTGAASHSNGVGKLPRKGGRTQLAAGGAGLRRPPMAAAAITSGKIVTTTYIRMDNLRRDSQQCASGASANAANRCAANRPRGTSIQTRQSSNGYKLSALAEAGAERDETLAPASGGGGSSGLLTNHLLSSRKHSESVESKNNRQVVEGQGGGRPTARRWLSAGARLSAAAAKRRKLYQEAKQAEVQEELEQNNVPNVRCASKNKQLRLTKSADKALAVAKTTSASATCSGEFCPLASSGVHRQPGDRSRSLATTEPLATGSCRRLCSYHQRQVQTLGASGAEKDNQIGRAAAGGKKDKKAKSKKVKGGSFMDCARGAGERSVKSNSTNTTRDTESTDITGLSLTTCATSANQDLIRCSDGTLEDVDQCGGKTEMAASSTCPSRLPALATTSGDDASRAPTTSGGSASAYSCSSTSNRDVEEGDLYIDGDGLDEELQYEGDYNDAGQFQIDDIDEYGCYYEDEEYDEEIGRVPSASELEDDDEDEIVDDEEDEDDGNLLFGSAHVSPASSEDPRCKSRLPWKQRPRSSLDSRQTNERALVTSSGSCKATKRSTRSLALKTVSAASLARRLGLIRGAEKDKQGDKDGREKDLSNQNEQREDWNIRSATAARSRQQQTDVEIAIRCNEHETLNDTNSRIATYPTSSNIASPSPCQVNHIKQAGLHQAISNEGVLISGDDEKTCATARQGDVNLYDRDPLDARGSRDSGQVSGVDCDLMDKKNLIEEEPKLLSQVLCTSGNTVVIHSNPITN